MAFLIKMADLQKSLNRTLEIVEEAKLLFKKEGIGQDKLDEILTKLPKDIRRSTDEISKYLKDKQSKIEEVEFLTEAFRQEYGIILTCQKYSALIENKKVASHFARFGQNEKKHANELMKIIYKMGGTPEYIFKEEKPIEGLKKENVMSAMINAEKKILSFYEEGLVKFRDAEFAWLIGNLKLEEIKNLEELEKINEEFKEKEICLRNDPDFKWVDPLMGEPGDRAWIDG